MKKLACVLLIGTMGLATVSCGSTAEYTAEAYQDLQNQVEDLQSQVATLEAQATSAGEEIESSIDGEVVVEPSLDGVVVDMTNIDQYLHRDNAVYVDVRDFADQFAGGYIRGFTMVPFTQYLENRAVVKNDGWNFTEADVVGEEYLTNVFGENKDAEIFVMCASGTKSGYIADVLTGIGYTNVQNVGGIKDYDGENKVMGDGEYTIPQ
ncbi:MAG: rhodanese-like domain-containing protein [Lachnospirales bacterium]